MIDGKSSWEFTQGIGRPKCLVVVIVGREVQPRTPSPRVTLDRVNVAALAGASRDLHSNLEGIDCVPSYSGFEDSLGPDLPGVDTAREQSASFGDGDSKIQSIRSKYEVLIIKRFIDIPLSVKYTGSGDSYGLTFSDDCCVLPIVFPASVPNLRSSITAIPRMACPKVAEALGFAKVWPCAGEKIEKNSPAIVKYCAHLFKL